MRISCRGEIIPSHRCRTAAAAPQPMATIYRDRQRSQAGVAGIDNRDVAGLRPGAGQGPGRERRADPGILAKGGLSAFSSSGGLETSIFDGQSATSRSRSDETLRFL
jgi:hypothetical protein